MIQKPHNTCQHRAESGKVKEPYYKALFSCLLKEMQKMLRLCYVIIVSIPFILYYLSVGHYIERHGEDYSEQDRYKIAQKVVRIMKQNGHIHTDVYGVENLPEQGGYVMYPNHQGKYDALGIIDGHKKPCTILMDEKRSRLIIVDQFMTLIKGSRLDKRSVKSQVMTINKVAGEVKNGRKYIIFPEGGYFHNRNAVKDFMPGAFKCAIRAKCPIVPVLLVDSYKPFEIRRVQTEVHYLPAIYPDEYEGMTTAQIAKMVRKRIVDKMETRIVA